MKLTNIQIKNAKPGPKTQRLFDGMGLYLEISPRGGRWWRFKYRFGGKELRLSLGTFPDTPLALARERRDEARKLIAQGIDPSAKRKSAKDTQRAQAETFERIASEWYAKQLPTWTPAHANKVRRFLELNAYPWLGKRPIREIVPTEILAVAKRIEARGAIETAHRTVGYISQVFKHAVASDKAASDPTRDIREALSPVSVTHFSSVKDPALIANLLRAIHNYNGSFVTCCALRLAPLVFVRPGELRHAEWTELDLNAEFTFVNGKGISTTVQASVWRIPDHKTKMRSPHIVPLSSQALAILEELRPLTGSGRYIFPGARTASRPLSENTLNAALRYLGFTKNEMTAHGFRSMASTVLNEQGWNRDFIERQLAHSERNRVRDSYNAAEYLQDRIRMMQSWSDYLDALREGGKVLNIKRASGDE